MTPDQAEALQDFVAALLPDLRAHARNLTDRLDTRDDLVAEALEAIAAAWPFPAKVQEKERPAYAMTTASRAMIRHRHDLSTEARVPWETARLYYQAREAFPEDLDAARRHAIEDLGMTAETWTAITDARTPAASFEGPVGTDDAGDTLILGETLAERDDASGLPATEEARLYDALEAMDPRLALVLRMTHGLLEPDAWDDDDRFPVMTAGDLSAVLEVSVSTVKRLRRTARRELARLLAADDTPHH